MMGVGVFLDRVDLMVKQKPKNAKERAGPSFGVRAFQGEGEALRERSARRPVWQE